MRANVYKILFLMVFTIVTTNLFSQELKFSDLINGTRPKGTFTSYKSRDGFIFKIGDKIKFGEGSSYLKFAFVSWGDGLIINYRPIDGTKAGTESELLSFMVEGSRLTGFHVTAKSKGTGDHIKYTISLENAIQTREVLSGEIKAPEMTSDAALMEMQRSKSKLDLGLITQAKYDSLKNELIKYIH